jgi:hypothetical protein
MEIFLLVAAGLIVGVPVGIIVGFVVPIRRRWLVPPVFGLLLAWWVAAGWYGDDYDVGRTGAILMYGLIALGVLLGYARAVRLGTGWRHKLAGRRD